ncbi:MAG: glycosyltransferase [Methanocellales archaeon]
MDSLRDELFETFETLRIPQVSVVIPTRDEECSIATCIEKIKSAFKQLGVEGEIVVCDNSRDNTPLIASSLGARVFMPDKLGYGYALRFGFTRARGDFIVMGDGDDTYDFSELGKFIEPLKLGIADVVIGSRFKGEIKAKAMPWLHRYLGNPLLTRFLNLFFKANISDAHSGFRALTRDALSRMKLRSNGMELASEMIIEAKRRGLRIVEVPVTYYPRVGNSKLNSFSDGWRHLKFMLLYTPKHLYLIPGLFLLFAGFLLMLFSYFHVYIGFTPGLNSMITGSLAAIVGYELTMLGLFASVYGKQRDLFDLDSISRALLNRVSLERGLIVGFGLFAIGFAYSLHLFFKWIDSDFKVLPLHGENMIGYTLLVIGLQTIFFSFFLSLLAEK